MIYDGEDWEGWLSLVEATSADSAVPDKPGAYVIRCRGKVINRAVDSDADGVLDIGESKYLKSRIQSFLECAKPGEREGHMAGWRYAYFGFAKHFPLEDLEMKWWLAEDKQGAVKMEAALLEAYRKKHQELPPLNYKFNWSLWTEGE